MLTAFLLAVCMQVQPQPKPVAVDKPLAVITEEFGKPFPSSIDGVRVLYFYADKANRDPGNEVFWQVWPKSYQKGAKKFPTTMGLMFAVPVADDKVTLEVYQTVAKTVGKDAQSNTGAITVKVNYGPRPPPIPPIPVPPVPVPPVPVPPVPVPPVPVQQKLHVTIFRRASEMTPAVANVLNDTAMRKTIADKGHAFRIFDADTDEDEKRQFSNVITNAGGTPCLILQATNGKVISAVKLPLTTTSVLDAIQKAGG